LVVNFEQILFRKWAHAALDRGDVFLEVGGQFDLNIHGETDHEEAQCACDYRWRRVIGGGALLVSVVA